MESRYAPLFEPLRVGRVTLGNRIVAPPMVSNRPITGPDGIAWYERLAAGGAGLVIVEATAIGRVGGELTAAGLRKLAAAIRRRGAAAAIQLFPTVFGAPTSPADLSAEEIAAVTARFGEAAAICRDAGFDGVEPHGAHGYLLNQFFSPLKNTRTDRHGGTTDKRMTWGREIVREIRRRAGPETLILYRHTPVERGGYTEEDTVAFCRALVSEGVDILDISPASDRRPADRAAPVKAAVPVPVIAVNDMDDPERALEAILRKRADLVAVGRGLIADAAWPRKVREGRLDEIVGCAKCNKLCFGGLRKGAPVACARWPGAAPPPAS